MAQLDPNWVSFRDAAQRIASDRRKSGRSRDSEVRAAVRKLWRAFWRGRFPPQALRLALDSSYPPSPDDAMPELLLRLIPAGGDGLPREFGIESVGVAASSAIAASLDPYLACPEFLVSFFLKIEITDDEFRRWRRPRAAGSRDKGRALARQWLLERRGEWLEGSVRVPTKAALLAGARKAIGSGLSERAFNDAFRAAIPARLRRGGAPKGPRSDQAKT